MLTSLAFKFELSPTLLASPNSSLSTTANNITPSRPSLATPTTTVVRMNNGRVNALLSTTPLTSQENSQTQIFKVTTIVSVELLPKDIPEDGTLVLELVSSKDGQRIMGRAERMPSDSIIPLPSTKFKYSCSFDVPHSFGEVGAITVENERNSEVLVQNIVIAGFGKQKSTWNCNSWVQPKLNNPDTRVFFANKSYLPSMTPNGLKSLREKELESLRGNGEGERKWPDRIYDYDLYNDLGDPDKSDDLGRPVLGGKERPYPRRCRTGRGPTKKDPLSEKKIGEYEYNYLPRDENFALHMLGGLPRYAEKKPILEYLAAACGDSGFPSLEKINSLFSQGLPIPVDTDSPMPTRTSIGPLSESISLVEKAGVIYLKFEPPEPYKKDKHFWSRDEEFARQTLAGLNPYSIQLVTEWPMYSTLDSSYYGSSQSLIDDKTVEKQINNVMTCEQAINHKRLFVLDYHDLLLPYVKHVRELDGTTLYGSRTLFFLCDDGTLKPIAIELTRPPIDNKPEWRQVFTPPIHNKPQAFPPSTSSSEYMDMLLWKLAKAHVGSHDLINHQLNIHWLRTHCCTEPYVIATHRQLSAMHPIYRLLNPHLRYTMDINGFGRKTLISAGGIAETVLSLGKYSMQVTTDVYAKHWRFDKEALPEDLIRRGMAVRDPEAKHGLRLTIEDYPFANDGLILWDAIVSWVTDYVQHYYADAKAIVTDTELQAWWTDIKTRGHPDKKDEPWWPVLDTRENLVQTLSTIIWVASGHHAAVNFGQYAYGGYFPNRIANARTNMPSEEPDEGFNNTPEAKLMECFPSEFEATSVMAVFDLLSTHSADEEYIGQKIEASWSENPVIKAAFKKFQAEMQLMEEIINERNANIKLKNRTGAHIIPYELLKPKSKPGLTGMGVPNSISI